MVGYIFIARDIACEKLNLAYEYRIVIKRILVFQWTSEVSELTNDIKLEKTELNNDVKYKTT